VLLAEGYERNGWSITEIKKKDKGGDAVSSGKMKKN
jgi:hypothetical protein